MILKKTVIFKVRIVYKSGYTHDFECTKFTLKNGFYSWESCDDKNKPIELGGAEIAAVWQVGYRTKYTLF
jgi:hypothetical protein